jgi:pimeloyl-ACP methyl ester carboxylesterase
MDTSPHKSDFVHENGINLHYLDWGGAGETLIFLTGMGCSAHLFDHIAPRFTDKFRVLALTRRGQGQSDYPESGYDADTLIDDILDFMDLLNVDKAILAGHSMAGLELSHFAATYPERVTKLIYLDAAYDRREMKAILENDPLKEIEPPNLKKEYSSVEEYIDFVKQVRPDLAQIWNEAWDESMLYELDKNANSQFVEKDTQAIAKGMMETMHKYAPEDAKIKIPILSFFAITDDPGFPNYLTKEQKAAGLQYWKSAWMPWRDTNIRKFHADVPHARIVEIPKGHHYCFMQQEDLVYDEMRKFLLG